MMNPKDNSSSLAPLKAHAFGSVTSLGKNGFEPLKATCKNGLHLLQIVLGLPFFVLLQDFQTLH